MTGPGLGPSPIARVLLDLADRGAEGSIRVGARRVVLRGRSIVCVEAGEDDGDLGDFLVRASRIDRRDLETARAEAEATGEPLRDVLEKLPSLARGIDAAERAMWLDRLVRGIAADEASGRQPAPFVPDPPSRLAETEVEVVPLVLDALARRATESDAEIVGARAHHRFAWSDSAHRQAAEAWCALADVPGQKRVARLLARTPAAAPRIAALVRAGLAYLIPPNESAIPPPHRPHSYVQAFATLWDDEEAPAAETARATEVAPARFDRFPAVKAELGDPLDSLEERIASLEQSGAPPSARSEAWIKIARLWQTRFRSLDEATRAYREAAAADPTDVNALEQASALCAATGRVDLAQQYARAAARVAPPERQGSLFLRIADLALEVNDVSGALDALGRTARDPLRTLDARVRMVEILRASGHVAASVQAARSAAAVSGVDPGTARRLLAWAYETHRADPSLASDYARALATDGYANGAVAVLHEAARRTDEQDDRRRLELEAAHIAERAGHPALAAELLAEAYDREPHLDILYEPLAADLAQANEPARRAVFLEAIAASCSPSDRAFYWTLAADAHTEIDPLSEHAVELYMRALTHDPGAPRPLEALRARADRTGDYGAFADALERVLVHADRDEVLAELALELSVVAEDALKAPHIALFAWKVRASLGVDGSEARAQIDRLERRVQVQSSALVPIEREYDGSTAGSRPDAGRRLAAMLRDRPLDRDRAIALHEEVLSLSPDDDATRTALERLLAIAGDVAGRLRLMYERALREPERSAERTRLYDAIAGLESLRGHARESADAAREVLRARPNDPIALARLERAAVLLRDNELLRETYDRRRAALRRAEPQALVLSRLAEIDESEGLIESAIARATEAVTLDPEAAFAVQLLYRYRKKLDAPRARDAIERAIALSGDNVPHFEALSELDLAGGDAARLDATFDALARLAPANTLYAEARLMHKVEHAEGRDPRELRAALEHALACVGVDPKVLERSIERLAALTSFSETVPIALFAVDRHGFRAPALVDLLLSLARRSGSDADLTLALERAVSFRSGRTAIETLHELAALQYKRDDRAAEARAHLRVLASDPKNPTSLDRLRTLYAETGETERLNAVLALRLEAASTIEDRREHLLDLAACAFDRQHEPQRAEAFVRSILEEADGDPDALALGASALVALGKPNAAVEILTDAADHLEAGEAGPIYERAAQLAEQAGNDRGLALATATRGLERGVSHPTLILLFERLALEQGDVASARRAYDALAEHAMGPHGRRAILYRKARWLERVGDPVGALEAYDRAFHLAPAQGILFHAIERLAEELSTYDSLAAACLLLAERNPVPQPRAELLLRAARIAEERLADRRRAFSIYLDAFKAHPDPDLIDRLRQTIRALREEDASAGESACERLVQALRAYADRTWDDVDRIGRIQLVIEVELDERRDATRAVALSEEILEIGTAEEMAPIWVDTLAWLAKRLESAGHGEPARKTILRALTIMPNHAEAFDLAKGLGLDPPVPHEPITRPLPSLMPADGVAAGAPTTREASEPPAPEPAPSEAPLVAPAAGETPSGEPEPAGAAVASEPPAASVPSEPPMELLPADFLETFPTEQEIAAVEGLRGTPLVDSKPVPGSGTGSAEPSDRVWGPGESHSLGRGGAAPSEGTVPSLDAPFAAGRTPSEPDAIAPEAVVMPEPRPADSPSKMHPALEALADDTSTVYALSRSSSPTMRERISSFPPSADDPPTQPRPRLSVPPHDPAELRSAIEARDALRTRDIADREARNPERQREVQDVLLLALRRDPSWTAAYRVLRLVASRIGSHTLVRVLDELLAIFDFDAPVPRESSAPLAAGMPTQTREFAIWSGILKMVWEGALPLFRRNLHEFGVTGSDRVTPFTQRPVARAYASAVSVLRTDDVQMFIRSGPAHEFLVVPTNPPAIVVGGTFDDDPAALRFRVGRAIELARPGHILLTALDRDRAKTVVEAIGAAFGPPELASRASRDALAFGASLWNTIPGRNQNQLRILLAAQAEMPPFEELLARVRAGAARAGLLVSDSLTASVRGLLADDPELSIATIDGESDFAEAVSQSASMRALVEFALSDDYLAARARALQAS